MNGYSEIDNKDGKFYFGNIIDDKKEGFGIFFWTSTKKVYVGFWKNNKQEGVGKIFTGKTYKYGFWSQGEKLRYFRDFKEAATQLSSDHVEYSFFIETVSTTILEKLLF